MSGFNDKQDPWWRRLYGFVGEVHVGMVKKWVYTFREGNAKMQMLLGGKGANLAEMTRLDLPVPPGFIVSTEACLEFFQRSNDFPEGMVEQVKEGMRNLEDQSGRRFGDPSRPLLVSVRSGASVSMPGMMDTVLNLGLNDGTVEGLARETRDPRFAYDAYRRFIQMFGDVVLNISKQKFEEALTTEKKRKGVQSDADLTADGLKQVVSEYKKIVGEATGKPFPQKPEEQLFMAVRAVFNSWNNRRAISYRDLQGLPHTLGTACNIQAMVFGNMGWNSGTGVLFTRDPATGCKELFGEVLFNAQGEDVVAGIRTPLRIGDLKKELPKIYEELSNVSRRLEQHFRDTQDIEFTIQDGRLYMLQTRTGKRTPAAAVKIAVDMVKEGLISEEEALLRVEPSQVERLLHKQVDPMSKREVVAKGLPASPGAAIGGVVFDPDEAERIAKEGGKVILVRSETTPDDIHGIVAAQGILTSRGGMTSHAAIVARGIGKPAVVGAEAVRIDFEKQVFEAGSFRIQKGQVVTVDGLTGEVILGEVPLIEPKVGQELEELLQMADRHRRLGVYANADTEADARKAVENGAEGIGLARTEHMFLGVERVRLVQEMILADDEEARGRALRKLLPLQVEDFKQILRVMNGKSVQIRLLDPPLHEFMPNVEELKDEIRELEAGGASLEVIQGKKALLKKVVRMQEANPMLGLRVCRLGIVFPSIYRTQMEAVFEAERQLVEMGLNPRPEIMIPGSIHKNELVFLGNMLMEVVEEAKKKFKGEIYFKYGTMLEMPRAALTADEIAEVVDFCSFGTNDLTQTTLGLSRDDAQGTFLPRYLALGILPSDPFQTLDVGGVGKLVQMAVQLGRKTKASLKIGICGEHGGEPTSIHFFHKAGLDYVSCSPFRIPVARLAAAQANVNEKLEKEGQRELQEEWRRKQE